MGKREPIRVLMVDDHTVVRDGVRFSLLAFEDIELVGEAGDGQEALRLCRQLHPDVVLMDLLMPGIDGVAVTRAIRERWPQIHVVALTSFHNAKLVRAALEAGANGYLLKDLSIDQLAEAIRAAHRGRSTIDPLAAQALAATAERPDDSETR